MPSTLIEKTPFTEADYERAALEYLESLSIEDFMDSTWQSTQRAITAMALRVVCARLTDTHYFDELLIQYVLGGAIRRVVPDGMVVLGAIELKHRLSYNLELEGVRPLMTMEYVSNSSKGKDYGVTFDKYEKELLPYYCVIYDPQIFDLQVYRHNDQTYEPVAPNENDRYFIPELELEIGVLEDWMRFWFRGELLELSEELADQVDELKWQVQQKDQQLEQKDQQLEQKDQQLEQKDQQLEQKDEQLRQLTYLLVQQKAVAAGREDLLQQLSETTELERLQQWLDELSD